MAAVVLLDDESSSRRLQVQIRIQMQIQMLVQIQLQTPIHSTFLIIRNWHQIHLQARIHKHIQVPRFPKPYQIHGTPRESSPGPLTRFLKTQLLGCSAGIIRSQLLGVRWLPVVALHENPKGVLDSRESKSLLNPDIAPRFFCWDNQIVATRCSVVACGGS